MGRADNFDPRRIVFSEEQLKDNFPEGYAEEFMEVAIHMKNGMWCIKPPDKDVLSFKYDLKFSTPSSGTVDWGAAIERFFKGAPHLVDSFVNPAPEDVVKGRRQVCEICEENVSCLAGARCCGKVYDPAAKKTCGCVISRKTARATESCPIGNW